MGHLILVDHFVFLHFLDRNDISSLFFSADANFSKGTAANNFKRIKVFYSDSSTTFKIIKLGSDIKNYTYDMR